MVLLKLKILEEILNIMSYVGEVLVFNYEDDEIDDSYLGYGEFCGILFELFGF